MKIATLGERLIQAMSWRGMNGDDLARASGVHKSLISRYKSNRKEPMDERVYAMTKALAVRVPQAAPVLMPVNITFAGICYKSVKPRMKPLRFKHL